MNSIRNKMDVMAAFQAVKADNRIALRYYLRIADNILQQANICRDEKNIIDLYVMLLRFSSLITETIPFHQDYNGLDEKTKKAYKKKLLHALDELEELKPKVIQEMNKLNKVNAANKKCQQKAPHDSVSSSSESPVISHKPSSNINSKQGVWPTRPLQKGPLIYPTAQNSSKDVEVPMPKYGSISLNIAQRVPYPESYPRIRPKGSYYWGDRKNQGASSSGNNILYNPHCSNMNFPAVETLPEDLTCAPVPSAPPIENLVICDASINFPSIDSHSNDSVAMSENMSHRTDIRRDNILSASSCAVCLDAPSEGAYVPCGHMAGCMTCLSEIKEKSWGCPICRVKIEMVLRLFLV